MSELPEIRLPELRTGWLVLIVLLVSAALVIATLFYYYSSVRAEHDAFMRACARDHKPYECQVMWRQTQPSVTVVYPIGAR